MLRIAAVLALGVSLPSAAVAQTSGNRFIRALDRMMVELAPQSARASKAIKAAYRPHLDLLVLDHYDDLAGALWNGGLAPLPHDALRFNVAPRVEGPSPIGEKDLAHQVSYIAARPATIGALLEVASRVQSGPVEVTSLVRHTEYQGALRATNVNATTSVPMHTMGLAFDIALINTPLQTVREIRDVLVQMRNAGEILFIGERRQLVFHVVPHPSRLGHFTQVYAEALGAPAVSTGPQVVKLSQRGERGQRRPSVTAEVISVLPSQEFVAEWWAATHDGTDLTVHVAPVPEAAVPMPSPPPEVPTHPRHAPWEATPLLAFSLTIAGAAWRRVTRTYPPAVLFHRV
jgi:hypothetical protein